MSIHDSKCERVYGGAGFGWSPCYCNSRPAEIQPTYGMCTACGSVEVALNRVTGTRDLSGMGESPRYPTGYGCEVCS